ncbi:MAG: flagellar hook capping FlgD N-terminal domain-containing protein, partial [Syntrophaceae bacterium]
GSNVDSILANISSSSSSSTTTSSTAAGGTLGKDSFMQLLVTQLQYQDPLNPMDNTEFTAQLAQFSQLEAMENMNVTLEAMAVIQSSLNNIQALSFIGKTVNANGNTVEYGGNAVELGYSLEDKATTVRVSIWDEDGKKVRTIESGAASAGNNTIAWDGRDDDGNTCDSGNYTYYVNAYDVDGDAVSATTYASGTVTGVRYDNGTTYLIIGDKEVAISDVEKIY